MIVVCDSTILIGLAKIGKLDLLREIFSRICVPEEVFYEVVEKGKGKAGSESIKGTTAVQISRAFQFRQLILLSFLD